jgi:hypothetical protein
VGQTGVSKAKPRFVEFDLAGMMESNVYSEFSLFYRLLLELCQRPGINWVKRWRHFMQSFSLTWSVPICARRAK